MISLRMALCKESLESLTLKILGIETSCDETGVADYQPCLLYTSDAADE